MSEAYHTKYRPLQLDEVIGQDHVVKSLTRIIQTRSSQAFLFCGPSGVGKTTLARITATELGCDRTTLHEYDAATHTGVDAMRAIVEQLQFKLFGGKGARGILIDECHMMSRNAFNSLLKALEEPPDNTYWFLCTTEPGKIPKTIQTRCTTYALREVSSDALTDLINEIAELETIKLPTEVATVMARQAHGSPRQALVNLAVAQDAATRKVALEMLAAADDDDEAVPAELCRFLLKRSLSSWPNAMKIVERLKNENPETVRIVVCNYMAAVLRGAKNNNDATKALNILEAFSAPYNASERQAPLLRSIGLVMFGGEE